MQNGARDQVALGDGPTGEELGGEKDEGEEREFEGKLWGGKRAEESAKKDEVEREGRRDQKPERDRGAS
jgi:hypothetical protein